VRTKKRTWIILSILLLLSLSSFGMKACIKFMDSIYLWRTWTEGKGFRMIRKSLCGTRRLACWD